MKEHFIVDESGRRTAVVLSLRDYERLLEDLHALRVIAERRSEPRSTLAEVEARLRADGLIEG
jgi:hypothetical protein